MNITKIKNDRYRVREMYRGHVYSKNYPYRPSVKEAKRDMQDMIAKDYEESVSNIKFGDAMKSYIDSKRNILSPETLRSYDQHYRFIDNKYKKIDVRDLKNIVLQNVINDHAKTHSPSTTKTFWHFIRSVLSVFIDRTFKVLLPSSKSEEAYIPTKEEVELILNELKDTKYFTPIYLAAYGLRVGEILALTLDDISDCQVHVNKTLAHDEKNRPFVKPPKTKASNRIVPVPKELTDRIKSDGIVYDGSSYSLNEVLHRIQKKNGIKPFSIHKLRHFLATTLHYMNKPKRFIESIGGWETNSKILEKVYTHTKKVDEVIELFDLNLSTKAGQNEYSGAI